VRKSLVPEYTAIIIIFVFSGLFTTISFYPVVGSFTIPPSLQQFSLPPSELSTMQKTASTNLTCTLTPSLIEVEGTPQQIEGPYFVDGMPNRSDIRLDTFNGSTQEGIPMRLVLHVYNVEDEDGDRVGSCTPLNDAKVDIWLANSQGI
jgi:protocatechuate 3,4-dioxygenase beta subunit